MFFNLKKYTVLSFLSALFIFTACSNDHKFEEPEATVVSLSYDTDCLSKIEPAFNLYKNELLSEGAVKTHFQCLTEAIDYIQVRVKGEQENFYNDKEIRNFLNKFLFTDSKKSQEFFTSLLYLKSQVFGGDVKGLSFKDLANLKSFLKSMEQVALVSRPFASELLFEKVFENKEDVETAVRPLVRFMETWIHFEDRKINMASVFSFLEEASLEIKSKKNWIAAFNLFRGAEAQAEYIENKEKDSLVTSIQNYYNTSLKLYKVIEDDWENKREDFFGFSTEIEGLLLQMGSTIKSHPNKKWASTDLVYFMNLVSDYELLGKKLSPSVREHVVQMIFARWFKTESAQAELSEVNFQKIILVWDEIKAFLIEAKSLEGHVGSTFPFVQDGTSSFALFTQQKWPSLVSTDRTLFIPDYENEVEFTFQSLFHASWQFAVARLLVESYTSQEERLMANTGLTIEEVEEAYLDVFVLLKEIEFLNEDSRGGWFRIFNEGNIFVPSAKGDAFVSHSEAAEYVAYMFSAVFTSRIMADKIEEACPNFVEKCSFRYARTSSDVVFHSMPGLSGYFKQVRPKSFKKWQKSFEFVAKLTDDEAPYTSSHWFRGTVANQYAEVIYRKFDLDASDHLDFEEVSLAYLDFKEALKLLPQVKGTSIEERDDVLKSFLTLFVKKGRLPKLRNGRPSGELIKHVTLCGSVSTSDNKECKLNSDRSKIMALLAYLTSL